MQTERSGRRREVVSKMQESYAQMTTFDLEMILMGLEVIPEPSRTRSMKQRIRLVNQELEGRHR
jgi:hypothetical protein